MYIYNHARQKHCIYAGFREMPVNSGFSKKSDYPGFTGSNPVSRLLKVPYLRHFFYVVLHFVLHNLFKMIICYICEPVFIAADLSPVYPF